MCSPPPHVSAAAVRADDVQEPARRVRDDVVRAEDLVVRRLRLEVRRRVSDVTQTRQVEDLHAVRARAVGDDEGVVADHLDVAPDGGRRPRVRGRLPTSRGAAGSVTSTNDAPSRRATSA
jgi:hypothetical protein